MAGDARIETIQVPDLPPPGGHYAYASVAGGLVFLSGHLPVPRAGGHDAEASFAEQATRVLDNLEASLLAAGSALDRLVKVTVYVTDIADWPAFDRLYAARLGGHRPARCVVPVPALHHGYLIEVEAVALAAAQGIET